MADAAVTPEPANVSSEPDVVDPIADQLPTFEDWLPDNIAPYWAMIADYPMIGALVIASLFFVAAHVVRSVLMRTIGRVVERTASEIDDDVLELLRRPIFTTVFMFGLALATTAARLPSGASVLINLWLSIIVFSWLRTLFFMSSLLLGALGRNPDRFQMIEPRTIPLFDLVFKLIVILVGSYCLLMIWGINPVGWLASAGIVGIAVGFAAKDTLANLFSGFFILADSPYKIGDYINLDSGERGKVTGIGMRSTRLLTRDDVEITIPNAVIANAKIINESGGPSMRMRVRIAVGAGYGSDVDQVCAVLEAVADKHEAVCKFPSRRVRMRGFGASSLDFELMCWINDPEDRGRILHELYMAVYKAFAEAGIEIPFSKQDLYIKELPERG